MNKLANKAYRDVFGAEVGGSIARQIREMRIARGWTQKELAKRVGTGQARISLLEDPNYSMTSINTLKRLAQAFDVGLEVKFVSFSELAENLENVPGFIEELVD